MFTALVTELRLSEMFSDKPLLIQERLGNK